MSFWFILLFMYNFLQIFLFLLVWSILLFIIYRLFLQYVYSRYPHYGLTFAIGVATLVTSTLLFELLHQYHASFARDHSGVYSKSYADIFVSSRASTWWGMFFSSSGTRRDINWFGPIWRLNPFYIATNMLGELVVVISSKCGRSVGEYVSGVFHDQSWITGGLSLLLTVGLIVISLFAFLGYKINVGIQGITISRPVALDVVGRFLPRSNNSLERKCD
ncbi:unnamed protein product [Cylicocyclus nassatus]|uniref:Uncharacterized protein n=1 Tax=Cylicocyclus nassatus TaxID=53992 RepID=A0AA36M8B5_CYLNA|nr:unnamed protein product [Cylicocyclus nassatus]